MSKVMYENVYGLWGQLNDDGNIVEGNAGFRGMPICPKCKEPTYNEDKCPFCGAELEYEV